MGRKTDKKSVGIFLRLFLVIIAVAWVIVASALLVGYIFLTRSIGQSMEENLLITVDIADRYVSKEIGMIKIEAAVAARNIRTLYEGFDLEIVLEATVAGHEKYIGAAVFDINGLVAHYGVEPAADLHRMNFMSFAYKALANPQFDPNRILTNMDYKSLSTTMHAPCGEFVMYASVPIGDGWVLAVAFDGLHLTHFLAHFEFWHGHIVVDDAEGTILVNSRDAWVAERRNFVRLAQEDPSLEEIAAVVKRGIAGERGVARFSVADIPRIGAYRPITGSQENWFIMMIMPLDQTVWDEIPGVIWIMAAVLMGFSLIAATVAAFLLRRPYVAANVLRREAEISSIAKSAFLANMSHEIRTPMNSIIGFSELALDGQLHPKTKDYLTKIQSNGEWLLLIINDILDISKIESGKFELEKIPFDMSELFASCRAMILPKAVEKGLTLYFYAEPSMRMRPVGDPTRLRQVFVNLLTNAVKFTNTGMVKLLSVLKESAENTLTMEFEVKDSGIGMTPEQITKIFDPFTQGETGTTRKYGGTGLGLTITRNIVELMGGKLNVESIPGVGSKFSFTLTFDTVMVDENTAPTKTVIYDRERPTFEGEVLICEDNAMNQQVICEHLTRIGLHPVVADNGKIGVDMVAERIKKGKKQFDLIFMDMHMPVMDGLDAADAINALNVNVPIVAMTANIMSDDREIYKDHGMADCVGKPFTSTELWNCLMRYFTPVKIQEFSDKHGESEDNELRLRLIHNFMSSNRTIAEDIASAIAAKDIKLAHRLAHTLKSNAGNLGKTLLQRAAEVIEEGLKDGNNAVSPSQMKILETELNAVLAEFTPVYEQLLKVEVQPAEGSFDIESAMVFLDKLAELLEMGSPECRQYFGELRRIHGSETLIQQIDDFEFENAAETLVRLRRNLIG